MQQVKVYVISLARAEDRRKQIEKHLRELGIEYELIDAVDGTTITDEMAQSIMAPGFSLSRGMMGCNLSHLEAYKRLAVSTDDMALVLEDHARLHPRVVDMLREKWDPSGFDVCLLDSVDYNSIGPVFYDCGTRIGMPGGFTAYELSDGPHTLHAYLITRSAAERRIAVFFPMMKAIDNYYHLPFRLKFISTIGPRAAWVSEHSMQSFATTHYQDPKTLSFRWARRTTWFYELRDFVKLKRPRRWLLGLLLRAEGFLPGGRRWRPIPPGREVR